LSLDPEDLPFIQLLYKMVLPAEIVTTLATVSKIFVPLEAKYIIVITINPSKPKLLKKEINILIESFIVKWITVKKFNWIIEK